MGVTRLAGYMSRSTSAPLALALPAGRGPEFRDELGVCVLNVDPAENIAAIAEERGIPTINDFWSADIASTIVSDHGKPKLITATNVFAHVDDVRGFVAAG